MNGELPEGWASAAVGEFASINPRHPKALDDSLIVSFAPMAAVSDSKPEFNYLEERPLGKVRQGFTHFANGDVLFAKITPCMENGKGAVAAGLRNGLGCGTTELIVIRPLGGIHPRYIYRFLAQPSVRAEAKEHFTSTAGQARVPTSFIEELEIPLAPISEQQRIVAKLEALIDRVDAACKRLEKIGDVLNRFRQSVLAAACSGRLTADWREQNTDERGDTTDLPIGWKVTTVGDVIESLKYGTAQKCDYDKRGVPVLRIPNVVNGTVDHADLKYARLPAQEREQLRLVPGDILLIRSNGSVSLVGRTALVRDSERDFAYAGYLIRLRPKRMSVLPEFLNLVLGTFDVRLQVELEARSTSGVHNINGGEVRALTFSLPPLDEQREIIRRVETFFVLADRIEGRMAEAQADANRLTPSLLAKAFRGELVPTEAEVARREGREYESAAALLERVQHEDAYRNADAEVSARTERAHRSTVMAPRPRSAQDSRSGNQRLKVLKTGRRRSL